MGQPTQGEAARGGKEGRRGIDRNGDVKKKGRAVSDEEGGERWRL